MQFVLCAAFLAVVAADPYHGASLLGLSGYTGLYKSSGHDDNIDTTSDDHDNAHKLGYNYGAYHAYPAVKPVPYGIKPSPPVLNCIQRQQDADGNVADSLSVNIKPNSVLEGALGGYAWDNADDGHGGLSAQVNVFSSTGKPVTIAITENANAACEGDKYGNFYGSSYAYPSAYGHGYGYGFGYHKPTSPSVIAKTTIHSSQLASFHVDRIVGFSTLAELAGRGVIVCPTDSVMTGVNGKTYCSGTGKSCCALHYAHAEEHIGA